MIQILNLFNLKAFVSTETELRDIARAANIGDISGPPKICNTPAATGIPAVL
jgi:hypothetical protein